MLIIKPIQDRKEQENACNACNIEFDADCMAYAARVDDILVGVCQFHFHDGKGHIADIRKATGTDDEDALFIMGRQTMNFINLCNVDVAFFDGEADEKFIRRLGFSKDNSGKWFVNLNGFFDHPCQHNK